MGSTFTPTGSTEVGIDGYIELFDPASGQPLGKHVAVQSKSIATFRNETDTSFDYWCDTRDLVYWLRGSVPVALMVSRLSTREVYWISIQDYFRGQNASDIKDTRVRFDKTKHRFTKDSLAQLSALDGTEIESFYFPPIPRTERLLSNLLPLEGAPPLLYVANTEHRRAHAVLSALRGSSRPVDGAWVLHNKQIFSFQDLSEDPWTKACDSGTAEGHRTSDWLASNDPDHQRLIVELLNRSLASQLRAVARYWPREDCFAYVQAAESRSRYVTYRSLKRRSRVAAVAKYSQQSKGQTYVHYRHMAFRGRFKRFEDTWHLEITPTYRFTVDGMHLDRFHEDRLKTIKQFEGNRAVLSAVLFWADTLREPPALFTSERAAQSLRFGELAAFDSPVGIDDAQWSAQQSATQDSGGQDGQLLSGLGDAQ
jgi:hypothetical protein